MGFITGCATLRKLSSDDQNIRCTQTLLLHQIDSVVVVPWYLPHFSCTEVCNYVCTQFHVTGHDRCHETVLILSEYKSGCKSFGFSSETNKCPWNLALYHLMQSAQHYYQPHFVFSIAPFPDDLPYHTRLVCNRPPLQGFQLESRITYLNSDSFDELMTKTLSLILLICASYFNPITIMTSGFFLSA